MSYQYMQMGITAVQSGSLEEGARLLRLAIRSTELTNQLRAIAYMWLAETITDPQQKRATYQEALNTDPTNEDIRRRVNQYLASTLPPPPANPPEMPMPGSTPPSPASQPLGYTSGYGYNYAQPQSAPPQPTQQPATSHPQQPPLQTSGSTGTVMDYVVTVIGGPNGTGTGFFPTSQPIIATTRYTVGGAERLTIELGPGRQTYGTVVRTFSDYDLALIRVDVAPPSMLPILPVPRLPDDAIVHVISYNGQVIRGSHRSTKRVMAAHWIPTDLSTLPDSGGNPMFDERNYLVGMMTRNTSRNSTHFFGVYITLIRQCIDAYLQEINSTRVTYCAQCGSNSKAAGAGFFYCEVCGSLMPAFAQAARYPIPQAESYYNPGRGVRCTNCQSTVGFHQGKCLRCGQTPQVQV